MRDDEIKNSGSNRLVPLKDLSNYKVAKEDPDARGWKVIGADGERLGVVKDLIVDRQAMKARYLSVEADRKLFNDDHDRQLLVPIGAATLDREDNKVFVPVIDRSSIGMYPAYAGGPITDDYEYAVREAITNSENRIRSGSDHFTNASTERHPDNRQITDDFYNNDQFNENRFYGNRRMEDSEYRSQQNQDPDYDRNRLNDTQRSTMVSTGSDNMRAGNVEESISTIERLEQLRERGSITEDEFRVLKKRALDI